MKTNPPEIMSQGLKSARCYCRSLLAVCCGLAACALAPSAARGQTPPTPWNPGHYVQLSIGDSRNKTTVENEIAALPADIKGIKIRIYWGDVEKDAGGYDWSHIDSALDACDAAGKQLVVLIVDREFGDNSTYGELGNARRVLPDYIVDDPVTYGDGTQSYFVINGGKGIAAKIYYPNLASRYIAMLRALGNHVSYHSKKDHLEAVYLGETAASTPKPADFETGPDGNFMVQKTRIIEEAAAAFPFTHVVVGLNYLSGVDDYEPFIGKLYEHRVAIGGPDIFMDKFTTGQEFLMGEGNGNPTTDYRGKLPVMFDVQGADWTEGHGIGGGDESWATPEEVYERAVRKLHGTHIFWLKMTGDPAHKWGDWTTSVYDYIHNDLAGSIAHTDKPIAYGTGTSRVIELEGYTITTSIPYTYRPEPPKEDILLSATGVDQTATFEVPHMVAGQYNITATIDQYTNRGKFVLQYSTSPGGNYTTLGNEVNTYGTAQPDVVKNLTTNGPVSIPAGTVFFRLKTNGAGAGNGHAIAVDKLTLTLASPAEVTVKSPSNTVIADDQLDGDDTEFGAVDIQSGSPVTRTYQIQNNGSANSPLIVGPVTVDGELVHGQFEITAQPAIAVAGGYGHQDFTVAFKPRTVGEHLSTVRFYNSDSSESYYNFRVAGAGTDATLQSYLALDEVSGTTAEDSSANNADGTLQGGASWTTGQRLNGVNLSGSSQYVDLASTGSNDFTNGITITLWVKPTGDPVANPTAHNNERFVELANAIGTTFSYNIIFGRKGYSRDLRVKLYNGPNSKGEVVAAGVIDQDVWQRFTVTIDSAGVTSLYRDGAKLITTGSISEGPGTSARTYNWLGKSNWTNDPYLHAVVDDLQIYKRVLTPEEVGYLQ